MPNDKPFLVFRTQVEYDFHMAVHRRAVETETLNMLSTILKDEGSRQWCREAAGEQTRGVGCATH